MRSPIPSPGPLGPLLDATSRTFALTIPLLPAPLSTQVAVTYLLYRMADTLEDAELWSRDERRRALASFASWIADDEDDVDAAWQEAVRSREPSIHAGYNELLRRADDVRAWLSSPDVPAAAAVAVREGVADTTRRMAAFVGRQAEDGRITLGDEEDLRAYCYAVAGLVGELLTRLFTIDRPALGAVRAELDARARAFGEGLQLVNILKDAASDAEDGRVYVPPSMTRDEVTRLARRDLDDADAYVEALRRGGAAPGVVSFCALPVALARATLDALAQGRAKLSRDEVAAIALRVTARA